MFKEIYNKRRTRLVKEPVTSTETRDVTPKFIRVPVEKQVLLSTDVYYVKDDTGRFVQCQPHNASSTYFLDKTQENIVSESIFVLRKDGKHWNNAGNPSGVPIQYFRKEEVPSSGKQYKTVIEYVDKPYKGKKQFEKVEVTNSVDKTVRDTNIVGTALAFTSSIWLLVVCSKLIWSWFAGKVTDGYWMVFFSPFILAYWSAVIGLFTPVTIFLSSMVAASVIYTPIFEFPAGFMNKERNQFIDGFIRWWKAI